MRASPRGGGKRSPSGPLRRSGFAKPHVGPVGASILAVLAGFPVLAQVGAFPPAEPVQEERLPSAETEPAPASGLPPALGLRLPPALPRSRPLRSGPAPIFFLAFSAADRDPPIRLPQLRNLPSVSALIYFPASSAADRIGRDKGNPLFPPSLASPHCRLPRRRHRVRSRWRRSNPSPGLPHLLSLRPHRS